MNLDLPEIDPAALELAETMTQALLRMYPGHLWGVNVNAKGGIADIRNFALSGDMGYTLHLAKIRTEDDFWKKLRIAGGEILERFRLSRAGLREDEILNIKRDFARRPLYES